MTQNKCRMQNAECKMQMLVFCSAFCILHSALIFVSPCRAQGPKAFGGPRPLQAPLEKPYDQRTDAFRRLLFELRFQPLQTFADLEDNPSESIFILLGNPRGLTNAYLHEGLCSFVERGGAVLIATDMPTKEEAGENLIYLAGVTVTGQTLVLDPDSIDKEQIQEFLYNNFPYSPYVEPIEDSKFLGAVRDFVGVGRPDLFHRLPASDEQPLRVATNAPSRLSESKSGLPQGIHRLARLPKECQDERSVRNPPVRSARRGLLDQKGPLFAVGGTLGKGRVLVLADHSIFINRMILPRDNDNMQFTVNCLNWLRGGSSTMMEAFQAARSQNLEKLAGERNKVLLWEDRTIHSNFQVPLKRMPAPPGSLPSEQAIVAAIDKTIAKMEETDAFNRALLEQMENLSGGRDRVIRSAVILLTLAALLFLGYRFVWRTRYRPELAVPLLANAIREHEPNVSLLDQRRRALLRLGNVWEMGHRLAQECFESFGVALTGATPPRVVRAPGRLWQRWRIRRRVARLWRLARGDEPTPLSPIALKHRLRELEELKTALANGTIELNAECRMQNAE